MNSIAHEIVALIPARGGSKGIPRKNLCLLVGSPLISYSVRAAKNCPDFCRTIVSTDDVDIAKIGESLGAEIIFRPIELAHDLTPMEDVVTHVLEILQNKEALPEHFALLQPTSPLRSSVHLKLALNQYFSQSACSLVSVTEVEHSPYKCTIIDDGKLKPLFDRSFLSRPRQLLPRIYRLNGAIFIQRSQEFLRNRCFFSDPVIPFVMPREVSVDVDNPQDLLLCETILQRKPPLYVY